MADGGSINLRLSLKGAEQIRGELASLGPAGSKAMRELDRAMAQPNAGVRALDTGVKEARKGLDDFAGRAGPVGSMLQNFGPWGLAAAVGIGAMGIAAGLAIGKLQDAMKAAADLTDTADRIGVSTTALQEWAYVADEAGVPVQTLQANLEKLNGVIGAFKAGIGDGKLKPVFAELGITPESLAQVDDAQEMMLLLADSLGQIKDRALQVKFARSLGVEESLPILRLGSEGIRELTAEAERLGLVMGGDVVKALDEADRQMEVAQQRIDMSLRLSVAGLADDFAGLIGWIASAIVWLQKLNSVQIRVPIDLPGRSLNQIISDSTRGRSAEEGNRIRAEQDAGRRATSPEGRALRASLGDLASETGEFAPRRPGFEPRGHSSGGGGGGPSAADRETEQKRREAEREIARLLQAQISAGQSHLRDLVSYGETAEERAEAAKSLAESERAQAAAADRELVAKISAADLMTEEVQERIDNIAVLRDGARRDAEFRRARRDAEDVAAEAERIHADTTRDILEIASSEARTAGERRTIERRLLELAQEQERKALEKLILDTQEADIKARLVARLAALPDIYAGQTREMERQTAGPLGQWRDSQLQSADEASEWLQGQAVDALDGVNAGLVDAWRNAENGADALKKMGQVGVDALGEIADALLKVAIQRMLIQPLTEGLFGGGPDASRGGSGLLGSLLQNISGSIFGGLGRGSSVTGPAVTPGVLGRSMSKGMGRGGINGAAGLVPVGEFGMEMIDMPVGARVFDADRTQRTLLDFDARMRAMGTNVGGSRAPSVNMPITIVNRTSEPVTARTQSTPNGGFEVFLEPAVRSTVAKMGGDGSLAQAHGLTPRPIKR